MRLAPARSAVAAAVLALSNTALAAGESTGTEGVGEAPISGMTFVYLVAGVAALGVVVWLLTKFLAK